VPAGLAAVAGNAQASLSWTAATGATNYNVKRATASGGPYTTAATPTGISYIKTGLTNGTTFYYVISALNAGGESANSGQVSASPVLAGYHRSTHLRRGSGKICQTPDHDPSRSLKRSNLT